MGVGGLMKSKNLSVYREKKYYLSLIEAQTIQKTLPKILKREYHIFKKILHQ